MLPSPQQIYFKYVSSLKLLSLVNRDPTALLRGSHEKLVKNMSLTMDQQYHDFPTVEPSIRALFVRHGSICGCPGFWVPFTDTSSVKPSDLARASFNSSTGCIYSHNHFRSSVTHSSTAAPPRTIHNPPASYMSQLEPHARPSRELRETCIFWYHGSCRRGTDCHLEHELNHNWPMSRPPRYNHDRRRCELKFCPFRTDLVEMMQRYYGVTREGHGREGHDTGEVEKEVDVDQDTSTIAGSENEDNSDYVSWTDSESSSGGSHVKGREVSDELEAQSARAGSSDYLQNIGSSVSARTSTPPEPVSALQFDAISSSHARTVLANGSNKSYLKDDSTELRTHSDQQAPDAIAANPGMENLGKRHKKRNKRSRKRNRNKLAALQTHQADMDSNVSPAYTRLAVADVAEDQHHNDPQESATHTKKNEMSSTHRTRRAEKRAAFKAKRAVEKAVIGGTPAAPKTAPVEAGNTSTPPLTPSAPALARASPPPTSISHVGTRKRKRKASGPAKGTLAANKRQRPQGATEEGVAPKEKHLPFNHEVYPPVEEIAPQQPSGLNAIAPGYTSSHHHLAHHAPSRVPQFGNKPPAICFFWYHQGYCTPRHPRNGTTHACNYLHEEIPGESVIWPGSVSVENHHRNYPNCVLPLCPVAIARTRRDGKAVTGYGT